MPVHADIPVVTIVVDQDVEHVFNAGLDARLSSVQYLSAQKERLLRVPQLVFKEICSLSGKSSPVISTPVARKGKSLHTQTRSRLSRVLSQTSSSDSKAAEIMMDGRVCLVFLLNTAGGWVDAQRTLSGYADQVRRNGGEVWAYGKHEVNSAGAMLFMSADAERRHLEKDASILFHLSTYAREHHSHRRNTSQIIGQRHKEIADLKSLFVRASCHSQLDAYLTNMVHQADINSPLGDDVSLQFSARRAQQLWGIHCFEHAELFRSYRSLLGSDNLADRLLHHRSARPVQRFFW